ncbi:MAG: phenylacetate--CoA ligase family protein, partial [Verrucomicrobia bacterium]|nr:phenylacetate--CoA ligase family protein [Verrucomicrobiota bacterium]
VAHCIAHSPFFAHRVQQAGLSAHDLSTAEGFLRLPPLSRRMLQAAGDTFYCSVVPQNHGAVYTTQTSGSTGEPVVVRKTGLNQLNWFAANLQDHLWHKRDFSKRLCVIRPQVTAYTHQKSWGPPAHLLYKTGDSLALPITTDIGQLAQWIDEFAPDNLLIYPNMLKALTEHCLTHAISFTELQHIRTIGETLSTENRLAASTAFTAKVEDLYSSQEVGVIAIECPLSGLYHVSVENLIVEVVRENGTACAPSETGRVVITDLHNFATPLIRYDIGDYAEVGEACPCGRGSLTLKKIGGRERNLIVMPDGKRHWPLTGFTSFREIAPIQQYQLIQQQLETIEVRLVAARALTGAEEAKLRTTIQKALGYPFQLCFTYFDTRIPVAANGKFEEFICRV